MLKLLLKNTVKEQFGKQIYVKKNVDSNVNQCDMKRTRYDMKREKLRTQTMLKLSQGIYKYDDSKNRTQKLEIITPSTVQIVRTSHSNSKNDFSSSTSLKFFS